MDISLIISFSWLKMNLHIAEIFLEGSLSQHIEIGLIIYVEEGILKKKKKNHKSFTFLSHNQNQGLNKKSETSLPT